jgi:hypothetical protein
VKPDKRVLALLLALVIGLFVAGVVWRALNPNSSGGGTDEERTFVSRQAGYYLCLHHPPATKEAAAAYVKKKLPHDDRQAATRGCQEALKP